MSLILDIFPLRPIFPCFRRTNYWVVSISQWRERRLIKWDRKQWTFTRTIMVVLIISSSHTQVLMSCLVEVVYNIWKSCEKLKFLFIFDFSNSIRSTLLNWTDIPVPTWGGESNISANIWFWIFDPWNCGRKVFIFVVLYG